MAFMLRDVGVRAKLADEVALEVLERAIPAASIQAALQAVPPPPHSRRRLLPAEVVILVCIAMNLFSQESLTQVLVKLVKGLRYVWPEDRLRLASKSAISQARYRVGRAVLAELFRQVCHPIATEQTHGAFLGGLRVMAVDGTREDVPDTPANAAYFGRPTGGRGAGAFPQVLAVYLVECGTHVVTDAAFTACTGSERTLAYELLRSVGAGDLLTWDRGFHSYEMVRATRQRQAHYLGRVPASILLVPQRRLADGSYLAFLYPSDNTRRRAGERYRVRVIDYTLEDPQRPGHQQRHRLITSLFEVGRFSALTLVCGYHERWEEELTIDEIDTHQRLVGRPLRSQKPDGVLQELYGLLLAHYAVRTVMHDAALQADLDPDRLSFTNALSLIRDAIPEFQQTARHQLPRLYQRLLLDILDHRLPTRSNRSNPRVVKRKMSKAVARK